MRFFPNILLLLGNYGLDLTLVKFVIDMKGIVLYVLKKMKKIVVFYEFSKLCIMRGYSFRWFYLIIYIYIKLIKR